MLQNPKSEKPQLLAAQGVHVAFDIFLDVQGVTGSSPVSSTNKTPKAERLWEFFLFREPGFQFVWQPRGRGAFCMIPQMAAAVNTQRGGE